MSDICNSFFFGNLSPSQASWVLGVHTSFYCLKKFPNDKTVEWTPLNSINIGKQVYILKNHKTSPTTRKIKIKTMIWYISKDPNKKNKTKQQMGNQHMFCLSSSSRFKVKIHSKRLIPIWCWIKNQDSSTLHSLTLYKPIFCCWLKLAASVDGWNPKQPPGMYTTGINYQPQLVSRISEPSTGFQWLPFSWEKHQHDQHINSLPHHPLNTLGWPVGPGRAHVTLSNSQMSSLSSSADVGLNWWTSKDKRTQCHQPQENKAFIIGDYERMMVVAVIPE